MRLATFAAQFVMAAAAVAAIACDKAPSANDLREWTAADHDRGEEQQRVANGQQAPASAAEARGSTRNVDGGAASNAGAASSEASAIATAVEVTWRNQCAVCHGAIGHGDGPNGPMVGAKNLTDPDFQASHTDADLAASITNGKGKMPKFDISPAIVAGLVGRIRLSKGR